MRSHVPPALGDVTSSGIRNPPSWLVNAAAAALLKRPVGEWPGSSKVFFLGPPPLFRQGRPLFPRLVHFMQSNRFFYNHDLHCYDDYLRAHFGTDMLPCPFAQNEAARAAHTTIPTPRCVWRAVVDLGELVESARVRVERCLTCKRDFAHTNPSLLSQMPAQVISFMGVDPDSMDGKDLDLFFTFRQVMAMRVDARNRQGGSNAAEHYRSRAAVEYVERVLCYTEQGRLWLAFLEDRVGDAAWGQLSIQDRARLVEERAEFVAFQLGRVLDEVPPNPNQALHSPAPSRLAKSPRR